MMCNALVWSFDAVTNVNWLDLLKTAGALVTACVAYLALKNWQRQDKAKREAEFLDALIDAVHAYIVEMGRPIALVDSVRIGMRCQTSSWDEDDEAGAVAKGAVLYIQKDGERDSKRLLEALSEARPALIKLRSLGTKGQVFGFRDYHKCRDAIEMIVWQFGRIEAVATIIGSPTLNWQNPEVRRSLDGILTVEPKDIQKHVSENNVAVLNFAQETYARLYGKRVLQGGR